MADDHELLAQWGEGDSRAGSTLFARHFAGLFRFFATKVDDEVEDLVQATLLNCVKYRARLARADSFKAYLFTIARRRLYQHLTSKIRAESIDFGASSIVDLGGSPSSVLAHKEEEHALLGALRTLPVELQVLLELHYWEHMTIDESAKVLELPLGTAKTRLRRARTLLRERLQGAHGTGSDEGLERFVADAGPAAPPAPSGAAG